MKKETEPMMSEYQEFIHTSRYARWIEEKGRRETWRETCERYVKFWQDRGQLNEKEAKRIFNAIFNMEVMPSMRCLMTAGPALDASNVAGYNCAYVAVDSPRVFDEIMFVLLNGTGVGFSIERQFVDMLPTIADSFHSTETTIIVNDSKIAWASAFRELIALLYAGKIPDYDVSKVRPAGARLKTFGGRASGPEPLVNLFTFSINLFKNAAGRRLTTLECHDLVCKIAEVVVVGGVRRSALISLSNLSDNRLRKAKSGNWFMEEPQRALANNSVCYTSKPDFADFLAEMLSLHESKAGERGIFSREAAKNIAERNGRRDSSHAFGCNPCSEIILRSQQFCNLSEIVVRADDDLQTLKNKAEIAAVIGTLQATLTNFKYLRAAWKKNTEEEALLGVSMTGLYDHYLLGKNSPDLQKWLTEIRDVAIATNKKWAEKLGINQATAVTAIKPSGTVSQLVNSASGIHPRFSAQYIRTVRADKKDPLSQFMQDQGFPCEQDLTSEQGLIFSFPIVSPEGSVTVADVSAKQQLELWKTYQDNFTEHKPSCTIYYFDDEFLDVISWIWKNFDICSGISLLPYSDHVYQQAPYQEATDEELQDLRDRMPKNVDWSGLEAYEKTDNTTASQELACVAGACEL